MQVSGSGAIRQRFGIHCVKSLPSFPSSLSKGMIVRRPSVQFVASASAAADTLIATQTINTIPNKLAQRTRYFYLAQMARLDRP